LPFGESACGGAGVFEATCNAKNKDRDEATNHCVFVSSDRVDQCNYIGGNHIDDWGCYSDVSDNCIPKIQAGIVHSVNTHNEGHGGHAGQFHFEMVFSKVPVVVGSIGAVEHESAHVQIFDVTKKGFKYAIMEPPGMDGRHASEIVSFVAAIPGTSTLTEGITMKAGFIDTAETVGKDPVFTTGAAAEATATNVWEDIAFDDAFEGKPALLTGLQSMNNQEFNTHADQWRQPWIVPSVQKVKASGFQVALDRCESKGGVVAQPETVGYIALTPGHGVCRKTSCFNQKFSIQHAETSGKDMGWDNQDSNLETVEFPEHFDANTIVAVASKSTRNGIDGGWMRVLEANAHHVVVAVDEDTTNDGERKHTSEDVSVLAFSEAFVF
jgi:hypothetical protein